MNTWLGSGWAQFGAVGLLAVVLLLLFFGRLLPRSLVKDLTGQANANAEMWRQAYEREVERGDVATKQVDQLLGGMATVERLIRTLLPPERQP